MNAKRQRVDESLLDAVVELQPLNELQGITFESDRFSRTDILDSWDRQKEYILFCDFRLTKAEPMQWCDAMVCRIGLDKAKRWVVIIRQKWKPVNEAWECHNHGHLKKFMPASRYKNGQQVLVQTFYHAEKLSERIKPRGSTGVRWSDFRVLYFALSYCTTTTALLFRFPNRYIANPLLVGLYGVHIMGVSPMRAKHKASWISEACQDEKLTTGAWLDSMSAFRTGHKWYWSSLVNKLEKSIWKDLPIAASIVSLEDAVYTQNEFWLMCVEKALGGRDIIMGRLKPFMAKLRPFMALDCIVPDLVKCVRFLADEGYMVSTEERHPTVPDSAKLSALLRDINKERIDIKSWLIAWTCGFDVLSPAPGWPVAVLSVIGSYLWWYEFTPIPATWTLLLAGAQARLAKTEDRLRQLKTNYEDVSHKYEELLNRCRMHAPALL